MKKISLSALCRGIGIDRLAARRFLERRGVKPDQEGKISVEDAKTVLTNTVSNSRDGDARVKAGSLLHKLSGPLSDDWASTLGLEESDPTIEDAEPEGPTSTGEDDEEDGDGDGDGDEDEDEEEKVFENKAKIKTTMKKNHLGMSVLMSPFTAMLFTTFALLGQAYLFGHLAHRVFNNVGIPAPMWFHFTIALIFECTGILIAASFNDRKIGSSQDGMSIRGLWLFVFFLIQVISDLCLFNVITNTAIGTIIVAVAMPIALLGYANLYMEENRKEAA